MFYFIPSIQKIWLVINTSDAYDSSVIDHYWLWLLFVKASFDAGLLTIIILDSVVTVFLRVIFLKTIFLKTVLLSMVLL